MKDRGMHFWSTVCGWLAIAFAVEALGLFAHELNLALALALSILALLLHPRRPVDSAQRSPAWIVGGVAMLLGGAALLPVARELRPLALALLFSGFAGTLAGSAKEARPAAGWALTALIFGIVSYLSHHSLLTWYGLQTASTALSRAVAPTPAGGLGPSFSGLPLLLLACSALLAFTVTRPRRRVRNAGLLLITGLLYWGYLYTFVPWQPPAEAPATDGAWWVAAWRLLHPLYWPAVLGGLLALFVAWAAVGKTKGEQPPRSGWLVGGLAALLLGAGSLAFIQWPGAERPGKGPAGQIRLALYQPGFHNWLRPTYERFGARSGGMFGNLPLLVAALGWEVEFVDELSAERLAAFDVLFMANQKDPLAAESIAAVEQFVTAGGSLLVLGDHTWRSPDAEHNVLDDPITPTHIRYRFDSAYYFVGGWLHSMDYWPHATTAHLGDVTNESGCVVGASLAVRYPATPLVIGRYGYSDRGHRERDPRRGYMDNGLPDPGERLGDLVLVAAENVGAGRVVVVGDTSGFVNSIQTQTWPFTTRVLRWLGSDGRATVPPWREWLGVVLLVAGGSIVLAFARNGRLVVPLAAAGLLVSGLTVDELTARAAQPPPLQGRIAYVDLAHLGRHSLEAWRDDAITGVYLNLMRAGYLPLGVKDFDAAQLAKSDLFVTVAPTRTFTADDIAALEAFLNQGGVAVVAAGWEDRAASTELLAHFGLRVGERPQGRAAAPIPTTNVMPNYWEAWPVEPLPDEPPPATLAALRGDPVIVRKPVGAGQLVVVGDTGLFLCRNLETEDRPVMPNIELFRWLVNELQPGEER
jgi:hypothetical protein